MNTPDSLSPPQLYDVIAGIGNNEMKGLVFGLMRDDVGYTASPLHSKTLSLQGETPAWDVAVQTPFSYCETFATVGVVAKSTVEPLAYAINDLGKKLALPLLGHLLVVSLDEEQSLADFHGPTQTNSASGVRPCQRRIEIMRVLRDTDGVKTPMSKLGSLLGIKISAVGSVAEDLAVNDIIQRESSGRGKSTVTYTAEPGLAEVKLRRDVGSQLLFDVADVLQRHFKTSDEPVNNAQIASKLIADYGYTADKTALIKKVSNKTNQLANIRKVLKSSRDVEGENTREAVWATEQQLIVIDNLLRAIEGVEKPTTKYLSEGREKLELIMGDYDMVNYLIAKARKDSVGLKRLPDGQQKGLNAIKSVVGSATAPLSIREVQDALLEQDLNLDRATIRNYLGRFVNLGGIATQETPEGDKYFQLG